MFLFGRCGYLAPFLWNLIKPGVFIHSPLVCFCPKVLSRVRHCSSRFARLCRLHPLYCCAGLCFRFVISVKCSREGASCLFLWCAFHFPPAWVSSSFLLPFSFLQCLTNLFPVGLLDLESLAKWPSSSSRPLLGRQSCVCFTEFDLGHIILWDSSLSTVKPE